MAPTAASVADDSIGQPHVLREKGTHGLRTHESASHVSHRAHAAHEDGGWGGDQGFVIRPTVCNARRELHHLISVRWVPSEVNNAGYSAQRTSSVAGVYRADSG